jgi:hypothetical protein
MCLLASLYTSAHTSVCFVLSVLQALAVRALGGRLQAGLEAFNRHAAEEMDGLLEVQRKLVARDRELQGLVSGRTAVAVA